MDQSHQREAFTRIFVECLSLKGLDEVLVLYDESSQPFYPALVEAIEEVNLSGTFIHIPTSHQCFLVERERKAGDGSGVQLSLGMISAISAASGVLSLLDGGPATTRLRRTIVSHPRPSRCRLAHVPGINRDILELIRKTPITNVVESCELLARALGNARTLELESYGSDGRIHTLVMALDGWLNEPILSPGVIAPASWGNVPGGETFYCPRMETVQGAVCINGSVPGHCVDPGEEVVLNFEQGRLVKWTGAESSKALAFLDQEKAEAERRGDLNWNAFAEIGFGANPAIEKLTGNSLFDEKMGGTVHVAIGDNSGFGHDIKADVHHDLVVLTPTLRLDGNVVILRGRMELEPVGTYHPHDGFAPAPMTRAAPIFLREARVEIRNGILRRRLYRDHRVGDIAIASNERGRLLALVCSEIRTYGRVPIQQFVRNHPSFEGADTRELLAALFHYGIVGIEDGQSERHM